MEYVAGIVGLDLATNSFHVHRADCGGRRVEESATRPGVAVLNKRLFVRHYLGPARRV